MNRAFIFFIIFSGFLLLSFTDTNPELVVNDISRYIKTANSKELAKYFNNTIDLTLPEKDGTYSKAQAELLVKEFFTKYPPKNFTVKNRGSSKAGSQFVIGEYTSDKLTFRTYFLLKEISKSFYIQQLQFEKQ